MISSIVRVTEKHVQSQFVSLQQEHLELWARGQLYSICLFTRENLLIKEYKDKELAELLGSAISNGRRSGVNHFTGNTEFYYLGER